jgi:hypothetical protein
MKRSYAVALVEDEAVTKFNIYPIIRQVGSLFLIHNNENEETLIASDDEDFMIMLNVPQHIVGDMLSIVIWKSDNDSIA